MSVMNHKNTITRIPFYYVRHAETHLNREDRFSGQQDIPLTENGVSQVYKLHPILNNISISTICHSPLQRTIHTAAIINEVIHAPTVSISNLQECSWGEYE